MAIIGKIREKSGLLIFVVGLGLLLFIIPFDSLLGGLYGTGEQPIGQIYGEDIYSSKYSKYTERQQVGGNGFGKIRNEYSQFQEFMKDSVYEIEAAKVGLQSSPKEFSEVMINGNGTPTNIRNYRMFGTPTGMDQRTGQQNFEFSQDSLIAYYNRLIEQREGASADQKAGLENYMNNFRIDFEKGRIRDKYNAMVQYASVASGKDAIKEFNAKNTKRTLSFVYGNYNNVPDSVISISDSQLKARFEKDKNLAMWKQDFDSKSLDYVLFDVVASDQDKANINAKLESLKSDFSNVSNDTVFIDKHSDVKATGQRQHMLEAIPFKYDPLNTIYTADMTSAIDAAKEGDVVGPFDLTFNSMNGEGTYSTIAKITENKVTTDDEFKQIKLNLGDSLQYDVKAKADSLAELIRVDPSQFTLIGLQVEPYVFGPEGNKGIGIAKEEGGVTEEINNFVINSSLNQVGVVKTAFAYHIVMKTKENLESRSVAFISKEIKPSKESENAAKTKAIDFRKVVGARGFETAAKEYNVEVVKSPQMIVIMPTLTEALYDKLFADWAFNPETVKGSISDPRLIDNKVLVAQITGANGEGAPSFEGIKEQLRSVILKEKKIEYLLNQAGDANSLEAVSAAWTTISDSTGITEASELTLASSGFAGAPADPIAVATAFTVTEGTVTKIKGEEGAYFVLVKSEDAQVLPADMVDSQKLATQKIQASMGANMTALSLLKAADVKDWRVKSQIIMDASRK